MNTRILLPSLVLLLAAACSDSSDETAVAAAPIAPCPTAPAPAAPAPSRGVYIATNGSDETGDGSMDKPYATFARAMKEASAIYACAGSYPEKLDLAPNVSVHGGLLCDAHWKTSSQRSTVLGLRALDAGNVAIEDLDVIAPDATSSGASSIAAYVQNTQVSFARVQLRAGAGAAGNAGDPGLAAPAPAPELIQGITGHPSNMGGASGNEGPAGAVNPMCPAGAGGKGGTGLEDKGLPGTDGLAGFAADPVALHNGGLANLACQSGNIGLLGPDGATGQGGHGQGTIGLGGFVGVNGTSGLAGLAGQGGGGGGGAKGKVNSYGASGASGGAGGCGGGGGGGGSAGGSSFALVVVHGAVRFDHAELVAANGGAGGAGGAGAFGADGGAGGAPAEPNACGGGLGGNGGRGGFGGSGTGGHSAGIVFVGEAPALEGATITFGEAGKSLFMPGAPDTAHGDDGVASSTLALDEHS